MEVGVSYRKPVEARTAAAESKTSPVNADVVPLVDATGKLKKLTWLNLKTEAAAAGATGATGAVGATGASGATGATGATGPGATRSLSTITEDTTIGSTASTDYTVLVDSKPTAATLTLLHFDETAGTTDSFVNTGSQANWTFNSGTNKPLTSAAQSKFGGLSLTGGTANDFVGNYIKPSSAHTALGTGDFTVEFWVRASSFGGDEQQFNFGLMRIHTAGGVIKYSYNGSAVITGGSLSTNTWHHIALVRASGTTKLYLNGTQTGSSYSDSNNYTSTEPQLGRYLVGYFDDLRICNAAVYTDNFTAPTEALGIAYAYTPSVPTLPDATAVGSNVYTVKNTTSASVTVGVTSSQLVNGAGGGHVLASGAVARFISDGSNWVTL